MADGFDDVIVGAPGADATGDAAGSAYLILGRESLAPALLDARSAASIFEGSRAGDRAGTSVAAAGDFNGDGRDDVVIGAPGADPAGRSGAGAAYVVFDAGARESIALDDPLRGVAIHGSMDGDRAGASVAAAGDFNGDGLDDVVVGAPHADPAGRDSAGAGYVVYGRRSAGVIDLRAVNDATMLAGPSARFLSGKSVSGLGDVNADGLSDIAIGSPGADYNGGFSGAAYVVWGSARATSLDLGLVGAQTGWGFRIVGATTGDDAGWSVSSAGDADGDEVPDVAIGARGFDSGETLNVGAAYVVFGRGVPGIVDLQNLESRGYSVVGSKSFDLLGAAVAGVGDFDGDGGDDLVAGAPLATRKAADAGVVYLLGARVSGGSVSVHDAVLDSWRGDRTLERLGRAVAAAGDFNGDGKGDLLAGAPTWSAPGARNAGLARIILLEL